MDSGWRDPIFYLILAGALLLTGCSHQASRQSETSPANEILINALGLVGTPYRYGGSTPASGFDCSGLIQYVYRESANLTLPRTVAEMNQIDAPTIDENKLQAGDLLIFATRRDGRPSHAGIYVGDGRFVHAPSGGGEVRLDFLSDKYWQHSYLKAKRPLASR